MNLKNLRSHYGIRLDHKIHFKFNHRIHIKHIDQSDDYELDDLLLKIIESIRGLRTLLIELWYDLNPSLREGVYQRKH